MRVLETPKHSDGETLDPSDWTEFRQRAEQALDDAIRYVRDIRERPVWRANPEHLKAPAEAEPPDQPEPWEKIYGELQTKVLPYTYANAHPRAWGWVIGAGMAQGIVYETWAAALNANVFGADQSASYIEEQVVAWFSKKLGIGPGASGILVSGASMANIMGLAIARTAMLGESVLRDGLQALPNRAVLYCSSEAHNSLAKAVALLGFGRESLRAIPVDANYRMSTAALRAAIASDRQNGHVPICVVGNAGTVNTGAVDDLQELGAICRQERLWFHVDGAVGALLKLSPTLAAKVAGLEGADSVAFDMHKCMHITYDAGCLICRHPRQHRATFSIAAPYLDTHASGIASGPLFVDYGLETSRPFRGLKIWMAVREHGFAKFGRLLEQSVRQAAFLVELITKEPDLRVLAANLMIVCFQFAPVELADPAISALNRELLYRLHASGVAVPSYTELQGRFAIRVAIANHRTTGADLVLLVNEVVRTGREILRSSTVASF